MIRSIIFSPLTRRLNSAPPLPPCHLRSPAADAPLLIGHFLMVDFKREVMRDEEGEEGLDLTRGLEAALHDSRLKIILLYLTQTFCSWLSFMNIRWAELMYSQPETFPP